MTNHGFVVAVMLVAGLFGYERAAAAGPEAAFSDYFKTVVARAGAGARDLQIRQRRVVAALSSLVTEAIVRQPGQIEAIMHGLLAAAPDAAPAVARGAMANFPGFARQIAHAARLSDPQKAKIPDFTPPRPRPAPHSKPVATRADGHAAQLPLVAQAQVAHAARLNDSLKAEMPDPTPPRSRPVPYSKPVATRAGGPAAQLPPSAQAEVLEQLIASALSSHPSMQGQYALVQSAKAGVDSARWQFYPTPSVSAEIAQTGASDRSFQGDSVVSVLRLQQPLWTGGRLSAGTDKAQASLMVSQAALEEVRVQLGVRVVEAYGDWLSSHLKSFANEKNLATHVRLRNRIKRRLAEGASAESDLTLAVSRLEAISTDVTTARARGDIALARLGQLLGRPVDGAALAAALVPPRALTGSVQDTLEAAISINPSVAKAQAQARIQEAVIRERRADLFPEVNARIERAYGDHSFANGTPVNRLFIGVTSRFGAGLSTLSNVQAARTQHAAALSEIKVQSRTVSEQVLADYTLALSLNSSMAAVKASLKAAHNVSSSYDRQFLAGRKSWLDVMNAARELAQIETQLADLQSTQVVVTWRLVAFTRGIGALTRGVH